MVLGLPLAKLIPEIFKAVSKPFVNVLKRNVPKSPFWKDKLSMVVGVPLVKLAPLVLKTITKPFVDSLKGYVKKNTFWKDSVFIPFAKYYNKQSVRMRLWTQGIRRNKEQVEKSAHMSDEAALELGAEIVANSVTFVIALVAIVMQQSISAATEKKKEKAEETQLKKIEINQLELSRKVVELGLRVHGQDAKLRELTRTILAIPGYGSTTSQKQNEKSEELKYDGG